MHISDALLSPAVGGAMWVASAGVGARCARAARLAPADGRVALMGVMGAFVFAAQMLNFAIPGTGTSGHIVGGILLAVTLGQHAAFLVMASVLAIQALFLADGGLLAFGCNLFNLGFFASFVAYPLVYRPVAGSSSRRGRVMTGAVMASVAGMVLGAFALVVELVLSGGSSMPLRSFALLVVPVNLVAGVAEGLVTGAVILALSRLRPDLVTGAKPVAGLGKRRAILVAAAVAALAIGGVTTFLSSELPNGIEQVAARARETSIVGAKGHDGSPVMADHGSFTGFAGSAATLLVAIVIGAAIRRFGRRGA